ncbi:MAG: 4-(cytidine 5'-diphospho)-2-C-methyl-D-erythritol kinase [Desulfosalsimonadaceae bacterium]
MMILSHAKINIYLEITGKRADGYHELISLMCPIELADTLRIGFSCSAITITCAHPEVPEDNSNLAARAARFFFAEAGLPPGADIFIEKHIPVGAGLGGGSSNAAAVLKALNENYGRPLAREKLMALGRRIGADVPFFIDERPALATGVGEHLTPWPYLPPYSLVLIYPNRPVSTAEVYRGMNFGLTKSKKINRKDTFRRLRKNAAAGLLRNDLEEQAIAICPEIAAAKEVLRAHGADGALMSGSGSAVFGLYPDFPSAQKACDDVKNISPDWTVYASSLRLGQ